jgi:hypothetical protein
MNGLGVLAVVPVLAGVASQQTFDLAVYGGTAGGVTTAVAAAREGLKVVLLEPGDHLGGMSSGGLSRTDVGRREVIGGMALEFHWRAARRYEMHRFLHDVAWLVEPRVAESILREMVSEPGVTVVYRQRLRERGGVLKERAAIAAITMESGETYAARVFADATYEGDLMAQAGVTYTWGREASSQYGESLAGVRDRTPKHQFMVDVPARDEAGRLLPEISPGPRGEPGAADRKVQAYNFRLCVSSDPSNQVPFPRPKSYDPARYELLARLLRATAEKTGRPPGFGELASIIAIPNRKADVNNNGAFSTDYIGKNYEYPEAGYARRAEIWGDHAEYQKGFFYFLGNDPRVPSALQAEVRSWGLAKDEFVDTDYWPHQIYIREARRMVGEYVMTQRDIQTDRVKPDPIGMGSYNSDSHNVQRIVNEKGLVENEGDMQVPVEPYQIPYRMLLPKRGEVSNLIVPVCFSASHVAYSTLRMEPQYMIVGHAAGVAVKMAIDAGKALHDIDTTALTSRLREQGGVMEYVPSAHNGPIEIFRLGWCGVLQ